jgi:hypothetical protein
MLKPARKLAPVALLALVATSLTVLPACDGGGPGDGDGDTADYDAELLAAYKRALPSAEVLTAPQVSGQGNPNMVIGETAEYPQFAAPIVEGINQHISGIVDGLRAITDTEPTIYNSETLEFVWGPYDNDDSELADDKVLVYIKDEGEDADFRYGYALARGIGNDLSTYAPVIWGGAKPDPANEDHGVGVTLWDFEANRVWEDEHNPEHGDLTQGRFAALYMKGLDADNENNETTVVLASLRGIVSEDDPTAQPIDFDHLYGHVEIADPATTEPVGIETFDFVSLEMNADFHPEGNPDGNQELLVLDVVALDAGIGRGEVTVSGGTLDDVGEAFAAFDGTECWDATVAQTYLELVATADDGAETVVQTDGALEDCGVFATSLVDLGVPSLDTIPQDLRAALASAAENGIAGE